VKKIRYIHELAYTQQGMTSVFRDWIPETGRIIDSLPVSILHPLPINPCAALFFRERKIDCFHMVWY
jgi:hypothetical protein